MNFTDVRNEDVVTRTYENGAVVEFMDVETPITPILPIPQPTNQQIMDSQNTMLNVLFDMSNI